MTWPVFPLDEDHMFASTLHERCHNGESVRERVALAAAQQRLRFRWGAKAVRGRGEYDGPTMEAVGRVQRVYGLPVTEWIDKETWEAIWQGPPTDHVADIGYPN